jgi:GH25 family lysozyme M1 (1,4-beta-N-acetylmuramidase)
MDPTAQAHLFAKTVGPLKAGEFVVLDIEVTDKAKPAVVAAWAVAFVKEVVQLFGLSDSPERMMVYTGKWFWDPDVGGSSALSTHPLWVSGYVPTAPPMPKGWTGWTLWQYTDKGKVGGVSGPVDMSEYKGTQAELDKLVGL